MKGLLRNHGIYLITYKFSMDSCGWIVGENDLLRIERG